MSSSNCCHDSAHKPPSANLAIGPDTAYGSWTCPMHPDVISESPADCPICGMSLEPLAPSFDDDTTENPELADLKRRLLFTAPVAVIVMGLAMGPGHSMGGSTLGNWTQALGTTFVAGYGGAVFLGRALDSLRNRAANMFTLIALGTWTAYLYSLAALLVPGIFPSGFQTEHGQIPLYFESAAVITVLAILGQVLELRARARTGDAMRELIRLRPKTATRVIADGTEEEVEVDAVAVGDHIRVRPAEAIPVDGEILEGDAAIDESMITGEPLPVHRSRGDLVRAGTVNQRGSFVFEARGVGRQTTLARIVDLIAAAQRSRAPIQNSVDRVAAWFVPVVLLVAVCSFVAWATLGPPPAFGHGLLAMVSVLIIACPCALGLATPMSIMVASGRGAQLGVLIRNGEALQNLSAVDTVVLDKTGTLTKGHPIVDGLWLGSGISRDQALEKVRAIEHLSEHPLAEAVCHYVEGELSTSLLAVEHFESMAGRGASGEVAGHTVAVGSERFLRELDINFDEAAAFERENRNRGASVVWVAIQQKLALGLSIQDPLREGAAQVVAELQSSGLRVVLLTGDRKETAEKLARAVGIEEVVAEALPADKLAFIGRLQREGSMVAMVGDGINDGPALASANVGIAMGGGTDVAIESAGVTLLGGDIAALVRAHDLANAAMANIRQNLALAFGYNALAVPIAAGLLYPFTGTLLSPMIASLAMSLSSVSVIGNALRLRSAVAPAASNH